MGEYILAIDCGTQSLRAIIFNSAGRLIEMEKIPYEAYIKAGAGEAEQNPETYKLALTRACAGLREKSPGIFSKIIGIGVCSLRDTPVFLDREGNPVRNAITWLDERRSPPYFKAKGLYKIALKIIGMEEALALTGMEGKTNWVRYNEPDNWEKTHKILMVSGYLNYLLTGEFNDSIAGQIGHIPLNYKKQRWCREGELNMTIFPIEQEKLPLLFQPGEELGRITKKASEEFGLQAGLPVIACGSDKGCETVGMGVLDKKSACLSFGTSATVQTTSDKYFEPLSFMPSYTAPIPGRFNPEVQIYRGYWMITWFKNEFGYKEKAEAEAEGVIPEKLLNNLLEETKPGSMGLTALPYWKPILKEPNQKGAIIGFGDVHTRAHVYRAVIEGLAFALKDGLRKIEKTGHCRALELAASGGASQSDQICQIAADIFNRPIYRGPTCESSGLGTAAITAAGLELYADIQSAVKEMSGVKRYFQPNPANVDLYDKQFRKVYGKMSATLAKLDLSIRKIFDYPEMVK